MYAVQLLGTPRHFVELQDIPRHSVLLLGTPRHFVELQGTPRHCCPQHVYNSH